MQKIYELNNSEILNVKGDFEYIGEANGKIYCKGENLSSPFVESIIPAELEKMTSEALSIAKKEKEKELNAMCDNHLKSFVSSALGTPHIYDASLEDQINLMGLIIAQKQGFFRCLEVGKDIKENKNHTKEQLQKVYEDGMNYKIQKIYECGILKAYLNTLDNVEAIKLLSWDSLNQVINSLATESES